MFEIFLKIANYLQKNGKVVQGSFSGKSCIIAYDNVDFFSDSDVDEVGNILYNDSNVDDFEIFRNSDILPNYLVIYIRIK